MSARRKLKLTKGAVKSALEKTRGNLALTAQALGVSRQTIYTYMERYPDLKTVREDAVELITDIAEGHLESLVIDKDQRAIEFWLRYRGKSRGYTLSNDVKVGGALTLPPDLMDVMKAHNIALGDVARELEILLREMGGDNAKIDG